jgi:ATP-dependent DNA helicase RecG
MKPTEKDKVMLDFKAGKINILYTTSIIEIKINIPNTTIIVIEKTERFNLTQLHQLKNRIIRSNNQTYYYIFTDSKSDKTISRLSALKTAKNGFELAEYDLKFRGAGELSGGKQWGVSDIAMEALQNLKLVEAARTEAKNIVEININFDKYSQIKNYLKKRKTDLKHFE